MTIDEAIEGLLESKGKGVQNIILGYWTADLFDKKDNAEWAGICNRIEDTLSWDYAFDAIQTAIDLDDKTLNKATGEQP